MKMTNGLIVALVFLGILLVGCAQPENTENPVAPQDSGIEPQVVAPEKDDVKENDFVEMPVETLFESPIENYALSLEDLKPGYFEAEELSGSIKEEDAFESEGDKEKAIENGWLESYQVLFQKEVSANVLLEDLVVKHELVLYASSEGAKNGFADWKQTIKDAEGFTVLSAPKKGEESIAYRFEIVGETEGEVFSYSTVSFRTKNIIHTVLVGGIYGGNFTIDNALAYADIVVSNLE
ncbi:MAG: hypothetical protein ABIH20_05255 [Candidatus Diapherotrites archaeon]